MRQFRFTLTPTEGHLNSFSRAVRERDAVERVAIRWLNRQRDGTATAVYRMTGRGEALDGLLERATDIETTEVSTRGPTGSTSTSTSARTGRGRRCWPSSTSTTSCWRYRSNSAHTDDST